MAVYIFVPSRFRAVSSRFFPFSFSILLRIHISMEFTCDFQSRRVISFPWSFLRLHDVRDAGGGGRTTAGRADVDEVRDEFAFTESTSWND